MEEERRENYPDILNALNKLDKQQEVMKVLHEQNLNMIEMWKKEMCLKLGKIEAWIDSTPCKERFIGCDYRIQNTTKQLRFMWTIVSGVLISLLIIVATNISVMNELRKEISFIKANSYGVQDYYKNNGY